MSNKTPESDDSPSESDEGNDVEEPAAMDLDSPEADHIELSQDGGETFEKKSHREEND